MSEAGRERPKATPPGAVRMSCPSCRRFLGNVAGAAEFPPCHRCGWRTTVLPPMRAGQLPDPAPNAGPDQAVPTGTAPS